MNPVLQLSSRPRPFIAVLDGPCGSGKTTLAAYLQKTVPDLYVVHMDDYYIPLAQKTPERLSIPGGNADSERLIREVLVPHLEGKEAEVRAYLCHENRYLPSWFLPADASVLIEGSYSGLPQIADLADVRLFLTIEDALQNERILQRNGPDGYAQFVSRWIPLEHAYHLYYHLPTSDWLIIDQSELNTILKG